MDAQREALLEIAKRGSSDIIGRAADYILREENPFRVFVFFDEETRVERVCKRDGLSREEAEKKIRKMDKLRSAYYNEYADAAWGRADTYDLCINLSRFRMDQAIEMITMYYK